MDLRRFLNVVFAHLTRDVLPESLEHFVEDVLRVRFDYEMTPAERKLLEYRRRERELGLGDQTNVMEAFRMPTAATGR